MAKIVKKPKTVVCEFETPPLNLLSGRFMFKYSSRRAKKMEGYVGRYKVILQLLDDGPIQRVSITMENAERKTAPASRFVMPVMAWRMLEGVLGEFLRRVEDELMVRDVHPTTYRRRTRRG